MKLLRGNPPRILTQAAVHQGQCPCARQLFGYSYNQVRGTVYSNVHLHCTATPILLQAVHHTGLETDLCQGGAALALHLQLR
jgi:hypothetical protein